MLKFSTCLAQSRLDLTDGCILLRVCESALPRVIPAPQYNYIHTQSRVLWIRPSRQIVCFAIITLYGICQIHKVNSCVNNADLSALFRNIILEYIYSFILSECNNNELYDDGQFHCFSAATTKTLKCLNSCSSECALFCCCIYLRQAYMCV